jgi:flagellar biosynthesis/type III secretory pathway chaperone
MTTNTLLQKILPGILQTEDKKTKQNHKRTGSIKPYEKNTQYSESNISLAAHTQILKKLNGRNYHTPLDMDT